MNNNQSNKLGFLPGYVSWLTIALALLAVVTFFAVSSPDGVRYMTQTGMGFGNKGVVEYSGTAGTVAPSAGTPAMMDASSRYYPYPYPGTDVPVTDTREFLKIYYNATMRTRDVPALTRRVETTVRGYDGRIDQEQSSDKYGYVSFAIPQAKYDAFRAELESLVGSRFITLNITSQNLLSQKVSIEEQEKQANVVLAEYKKARQRIVTQHTEVVQSLQQKIDAAQTSTDKTSLQQELVNENALHAKVLSAADSNIKYAQDWVKAVQTQDKTLLANVATVTGTISVQWIGLWETALLYLPGYWIPAIFAVLAVLSYRRDRRRSALV